jgi:hypothetical protein
MRTLCELELGNGLPFVDGDEPSGCGISSGLTTAAGEIDDKLATVVAEGGEHSLEVGWGEVTRGEEERGYDDLLHDDQLEQGWKARWPAIYAAGRPIS